MIIYKYLDQEGALKTVEKNSVVLREPEEFNDPFDCKFYSDKEEKDSAFDLFLNWKIFEMFYDKLVRNPSKNNLRTRILKTRLQSIAKDIKETKAYFWQPDIEAYIVVGMKMLGYNKASLKKQFNEMLDNVYTKMRQIVIASCFGSNYDSILMWSHYADKHKGACIEYEIEDKDFKKVSYSETLPNFELTRLLSIIFGHMFLNEDPDMEKDEYQFALMPLLTKSKDWEYEGETRCVYSKNKPNSRIYDGKDKEGKPIKLLDMTVPIKRIFVGCKANEGFVDELRKVASNIPVIQMEMSDMEYKVFPKND